MVRLHPFPGEGGERLDGPLARPVVRYLAVAEVESMDGYALTWSLCCRDLHFGPLTLTT